MRKREEFEDREREREKKERERSTKIERERRRVGEKGVNKGSNKTEMSSMREMDSTGQ